MDVGERIEKYLIIKSKIQQPKSCNEEPFNEGA